MHKLSVAIACIVVILFCVLPMGLSPYWNGTCPTLPLDSRIPSAVSQYEELADALIEGHLYVDYGDMDPDFLALDNPYDYVARTRAHVYYHWDHAYYRGHYYVYYGVVPCVLLFVPYRLITGHRLPGWRGSQILCALAVIAIFAWLSLLRKRFFPRLPDRLFCPLAAALAMISVHYASQAPSLYCTPILAGIACEMTSLTFYLDAVCVETRPSRQVRLATWGALFGALTFGCRPPIALANLIAVPLAAIWVRNRRLAKESAGSIIRQLIRIALPYVIIGVLLMLYNDARFDNPLEFGQTWQLTVTDQTAMSHPLAGFSLKKEGMFLYHYFLMPVGIRREFPWFFYGGTLVTYPVMWLLALSIALLVIRRIAAVRKEQSRASFPQVSGADLAKRSGDSWNPLRILTVSLAICTILIPLVNANLTPLTNERGHMDIYFLVGSLCFLAVAQVYTGLKTRRAEAALGTTVIILSAASFAAAALLFLMPDDGNFTWFYPEVLESAHALISHLF